VALLIPVAVPAVAEVPIRAAALALVVAPTQEVVHALVAEDIPEAVLPAVAVEAVDIPVALSADNTKTNAILSRGWR